ncbi:HIT-like domain-containing protein [Chiua virens]|nr:HIT-like domain-containing protein [Chiua virens]
MTTPRQVTKGNAASTCTADHHDQHIIDLSINAPFARSSNVNRLPSDSSYLYLDAPIVTGEIPSFKIDETELSYAFLALPPVTEGHLHALVVPKDHAVKMHEVPDDYLADVIRLAKKVAIDHGLVDYNIIQNNGRIAYQSVDHVHFHVIDKPDVDTGLVVKWPPQKSPEELEVYRAELFKKTGAEGKTLYDD